MKDPNAENIRSGCLGGGRRQQSVLGLGLVVSGKDCKRGHERGHGT